MITKRIKKVTLDKTRVTLPKKVLTKFKISVKSRHPSHSSLRKSLPLLPFRGVVRLGSITPSIRKYECNSIEGVKNSSSKLLMKQCFTRSNIKTADWWTIGNNNSKFRKSGTIDISDISELPYPIIAKSLHGSRGEGNSKLDTKEQLETWVKGKNLSNYIFERFYSYSSEYRLHIGSEGCFYACRKMLKKEADKSTTWQRHDDNCVWIVEANPNFDKPDNWNNIVNDCIKAKESLSLDICAFDVKIQSNTDYKGKRRTNPEWIVIESCSAPSFGDITLQKYIVEIPKVLKKKYGI